MAKRPQTLKALIPTYEKDRGGWRRKILTSVLRARKLAGVRYDPRDRLELVVLLYLKKGKRHTIHDIDNRLKDILDSLQGRFGGPKSARKKTRVIENDNQVCRVVMEKQPIPKKYPNDDVGSRLLIRPYRAHRWPLQISKGHRLHKRAR